VSGTPHISVVRVPTHSASRYLQQLAKHWSHKMTVAFTEEEGTITFPTGSVLTVPEGEDTGRMREVVASHLDRFAFREAPLTFDWREG
jgi:uncharacterized protein